MKNIVLLSLLILMFCLTELTLTYYLPMKKTDFDVWLQYFMIKDSAYDAMFFFFSLVCFWNTQDKVKALSSFLVIVTGGSVIDKVIFKLNQYLYSDVLLIIVAATISIYLYRTRWKILKRG